MRAPASGILSSHSGAGGSCICGSRSSNATKASAWLRIAWSATPSGKSRMASRPSDITATAGVRRPPHALSTRSIIGHVATTIIVAQMKAARNGARIYSEPPISPPMNSTDSVIRPSSGRGFVISEPLLHVLERIPGFAIAVWLLALGELHLGARQVLVGNLAQQVADDVEASALLVIGARHVPRGKAR